MNIKAFLNKIQNMPSDKDTMMYQLQQNCTQEQVGQYREFLADYKTITYIELLAIARSTTNPLIQYYVYTNNKRYSDTILLALLRNSNLQSDIIEFIARERGLLESESKSKYFKYLK